MLNGESQDVSGARTQACFRELRAARAKLEGEDTSLPPMSKYKLKVVSINNFPTAAGLASSAAGFAALVRSIANLYELPLSPTELSRIARQGSGSACRSLFGGYVGWNMGKANDGSDSVAYEVKPASHWPEMRACILVVSAAKKGVSSTTGMQATVGTSTLFQERAASTVPMRMAEMETAIARRDFAAFAKLTMKDSNSFHATCLDTDPPIFYMNDISRAAIKAVETINELAEDTVAAYTFDAGPNAVIYYQEKDSEKVAGVLKKVLRGREGWEGKRGSEVKENATAASKLDDKIVSTLKDGVSRVILTGVGSGPTAVEKFLVDEKGNPTG